MRADVSAAFTDDHDGGVWGDARARPRRRVPARLLRLASDERLVELVRSGSDAAFEALFDRHHRGVLGFCRHTLGSVEEAEDAVQHTFLAAYRELVGTDKPIQLRPWLYTIARNRCLTVLRGRRHQAAAELSEPPTEHLAAAVERRHELQDLLRDVAALPDDQREALVLSELGDMSHDEIAAVLGCRREKVKALVFQARSSLISSRTARETPCPEIREQLANLRGGSLRRVELKRHVRECAGCREFREQVRAQRRDLAIVLPVAPTVGLKAAVVGGTAGAAGSAASVGSAGIAAKLLVAAAIVGGGTVAVERAVEKPQAPARAPASATQPAGAVAASQAAHMATPEHAAAIAAPMRSSAQPATRRKLTRNGSVVAPGHKKKTTAKTRRPHAQKPSLAPGQAKKRAAPAPPGQAKKPPGFAPPGQAKNATEFVPPGQAMKPPKPVPPGQIDKAPPSNSKTVVPGQVKKVAVADAAPTKPVKAEKSETVATPENAATADAAQG
jgi:RNA polymerase sigma factor (sigma-70 family)